MGGFFGWGFFGSARLEPLITLILDCCGCFGGGFYGYGFFGSARLEPLITLILDCYGFFVGGFFEYGFLSALHFQRSLVVVGVPRAEALGFETFVPSGHQPSTINHQPLNINP